MFLTDMHLILQIVEHGVPAFCLTVWQWRTRSIRICLIVHWSTSVQHMLLARSVSLPVLSASLFIYFFSFILTFFYSMLSFRAG
jgi:hypothetical protein